MASHSTNRQYFITVSSLFGCLCLGHNGNMLRSCFLPPTAVYCFRPIPVPLIYLSPALKHSLLRCAASFRLFSSTRPGGRLLFSCPSETCFQNPPSLPPTYPPTHPLSAALETFGRTLAGPMSGYLFDAVGARGVPLSCSCAAAYVAVVLTVRGFADVVRGGEVAGGEAGADGPHKWDSKTYIKRK